MKAILVACLYFGHLTAPVQLPTPKQEICRADMDGENEGFLWAYWADWYYDECA